MFREPHGHGSLGPNFLCSSNFLIGGHPDSPLPLSARVLPRATALFKYVAHIAAPPADFAVHFANGLAPPVSEKW